MPLRGAGRRASGPSGWKTMSEACEILGVNEATLRTWADQGKIRTFRTPGGHRRFAERDLLSLLEQQHPQEAPELSALLGQMAFSQLLEITGDLAKTGGGVPEERDLKSRLGAGLLSAVMRYISQGRGKAQLLEEGRQIGEESGREAARLGLSLVEAFETYIGVRNSLYDSLSRYVLNKGSIDEADVYLVKEIFYFMDSVLLATTEGYESARRVAEEAEVATPSAQRLA